VDEFTEGNYLNLIENVVIAWSFWTIWLDGEPLDEQADRMTWSKSILIGVMAALVGLSLATVAGGTSQHVYGLAVPLLCVAIAFAMQWLAFVPAAIGRTEHFYDLWGALTYLVCTATAVLSSASLSSRDFLLAALVAVWALRLGIFLFLRVRQQGGDSRFDEIKVSPPRFFVAWSLQGLWVSLTLLAVLVSIGNQDSSSLGPSDFIGATLWLLGFTIEVVADAQKRRFRNSGSEQPLISSGLWAWSRHPNYFGEIILWSGVAIVASATMSGWAWIGLVSPVFVFVLLRFGSGIPLLEESSDRRYGTLSAYQEYKRKTPLLIMLPPK
jgi:steroid 5-alpha reductase family enzyme